MYMTTQTTSLSTHDCFLLVIRIFVILSDNSTDECDFMCGDTCLESDDVCDGENDCSDFSDEDLCRKFTGRTVSGE